jgi:hypothetical protein
VRAARGGTWRGRLGTIPRAAPWTWDLLLAVTALIAVGGSAIVAEVGQDQDYHRFADGRALAGIPNALDVLSNAAFALVGALGLHAASRRDAFPDPRARAAWMVLFGAVAATAGGSAYYHLAPDDARLAWDRLPMAAGFMALVAALAGERFGVAVGRRLLFPLVLLGVASVVWWAAGARLGGGNLLPFLVVQGGAVAAVPLLLVGRPAAAGPRGPWVLALALYVLAKLLELWDRACFAVLGVSGHTLKHLAAAAAIGVLALELRRRQREAGAGRSARSSMLSKSFGGA